MPLFWKPYRSEATQFLDSLKHKDPQLEQRQRQGRSLLWEPTIDRSVQRESTAARVAQQPYVYQTRS